MSLANQPMKRMTLTIIAGLTIWDISKYLFLSRVNRYDCISYQQGIHAPLDEVWNLISDIDREPEFWHDTKSVKNIRKEENVVERETVIAFRNDVCKEIVILDPKNSVKKKIMMDLSQVQKILQ